MAKQVKPTQHVLTDRQTRKLRQIGAGIKSEEQFAKAFSHVKNPETLAKLRERLNPYLRIL